MNNNDSAEWRRSNPDVVVYLPRGGDANDGDNEHFLVFQSPKSDTLIATWTQSTVEAHGDNHAVMARSSDGITWSDPQWIVGTHKDTNETQASWQFPVVTRSGRIYCFYTKSPQGTRGGGSGVMGGLYSDDDGETWGGDGEVRIPRAFGNPSDPSEETCGFIVWQIPIRDRKGRVIAGYTLWDKQNSVASLNFMRFVNIDADPEIGDLEIEWLPRDPWGITLPADVTPQGCEEPSLALLPDGRLFVTMRTRTGFIWYSVSDDNAESWRETEILKYADDGEPVRHPLAPCPIYPLDDGRYMLLFFNNSYYARNELYGEPLPEKHPGVKTAPIWSYRRPAFIAVGEYRPEAHQPIRFGTPRQILDTDGVPVGPKGTSEIATYTSLTHFKGRRTLWYPDRKHFLLGKHITDEMIEG